jgi:hypothetical protein
MKSLASVAERPQKAAASFGGRLEVSNFRDG